VYAKRSVNSNGKKRGNVSELLISSFDQEKYIPVESFLRESFSRYGKFLPKFEISQIKIDKSRFSFCNEVSQNEVNNIAYNFHKNAWEPITLDEEYYLKDGQHRLAAAKLMGLKYIDAFIFIDKPVKTETKSRKWRDIF
ncbi:MAG: ParB-like nuclease domain-containing protein, partial [Treponema sp.]|nr:ParB-like nuclease domain-containing protein [Treponema sp.]